jgi:hypothetical protein
MDAVLIQELQLLASKYLSLIKQCGQFPESTLKDTFEASKIYLFTDCIGIIMSLNGALQFDVNKLD